MTIATDLHETPQALFGVSRPVRDGHVNRSSMTLGAGFPDSTAALGVLLDDILGFTLYHRRGDRAGLVSAALSVDFAPTTGWRGPHLASEARVETLDEDGGLSSTRVVDSAGTLIATGTLWGSFVDGVSENRPVLTATAPEPMADGPSAPPLDLLGGRIEETGTGSRLTVPVNPALSNVLGMMHGGIQTCALDLAGSIAAGPSMRTAALRANFFRPVPLDGPTVFDAEVMRAGRRVSVVRVTVRDHAGRDCSVATVTCRRAAGAPATDRRDTDASASC
ncbi:PaaI family thioesterase [Rhodococcus sp. NPDC004095]